MVKDGTIQYHVPKIDAGFFFFGIADILDSDDWLIVKPKDVSRLCEKAESRWKSNILAMLEGRAQIVGALSLHI